MTDNRLSAKCPLCLSTETLTIDVVNTDDLITRFKDEAYIDVTSFYTSKYICLHKCSKCDLRFFAITPCDRAWSALPGDDSFYGTLATLPWYYPSERDDFRYMRSVIYDLYLSSGNTPRPTVLDVGCGKGTFLKSLVDIATIRASETSSHALAELQQSGIQVDVPDYAYNVVTAFHVLEHVPDPRQFIEYCISRLLPGGILFFSVPDPLSDSNLHCIWDNPPHHTTRWSENALKFISHLFPVDEIAYFTTVLSLNELLDLRRAMRKRAIRYGRGYLVKRVFSRMLDVFDPLLVSPPLPSLRGLSHGVLLRKRLQRDT